MVRPSRAPTSGPARPAVRRRTHAAPRASSYWAVSRAPNSSGSSAPRATGIPASSSCGNGTAAGEGATPIATFEAGQTSSVVCRSASRRSSAGSSTALTPCPIRSAFSSSRQARILAGPLSSPPCGTSISPALAAIRNAGAKSAVVPRRSSLDRPKPVTPRPAYTLASLAAVRASSGCRTRFEAMITAIPTPVACSAFAVASSTSSTKAVRPPNMVAYPDGSTWSSSQPEPSARSSSASSVISLGHHRARASRSWRCRTAAGT